MFGKCDQSSAQGSRLTRALAEDTEKKLEGQGCALQRRPVHARPSYSSHRTQLSEVESLHFDASFLIDSRCQVSSGVQRKKNADAIHKNSKKREFYVNYTDFSLEA